MTRHSGGRGLVPREDTADARGTHWSRVTRFRTKPAWCGTAVSTLWAPGACRSVALRAERRLRFIDPLPDISCVGTSMRRSVYESRAVGALQQARSGSAGHDNARVVARHPGQNDERRLPHVERCKRSDTPAQTRKDRNATVVGGILGETTRTGCLTWGSESAGVGSERRTARVQCRDGQSTRRRVVGETAGERRTNREKPSGAHTRNERAHRPAPTHKS